MPFHAPLDGGEAALLERGEAGRIDLGRTVRHIAQCAFLGELVL